MKEQPILFSGEMVRAILDGRKTMTRRVVKPQPSDCAAAMFNDAVHEGCVTSPYGAPGDGLWVRETWGECEQCGTVNYAATVNRPRQCAACDFTVGRWRPSIHMQRWASRLTLEVTAVRVERVQDITTGDACDEGIKPSECRCCTVVEAFAELWDSINGKRPGCAWEDNPYVWVVSFRKVD